jgi:hypothetical protein
MHVFASYIFSFAVGQVNFFVHELEDEKQVVKLSRIGPLQHFGLEIHEEVINCLKKMSKFYYI